MPRPDNHRHVRRGRRLGATVIALVVGLVVAATSSIAGGKSFTLRVVKNVHVDNTVLAKEGIPVQHMVNTHEAVVVGPTGYAVYTFKAETTHHLICKKTTSTKTNCWAFWPPVSVNSARGLSAQPGVSGRLGTFRNHGTLQLTLNGQPLYYFTPDLKSGNKGAASGALLNTFGSTWELVTSGAS
jgi:predicted lipoprotein with Yx(FWY)xxD motif